MNMIGSHDREITDIEYPKQIKNLIIYHRSVYKYLSMVKFMKLIYAYKKKSETDLDNAREGEHITLYYY